MTPPIPPEREPQQRTPDQDPTGLPPAFQPAAPVVLDRPPSHLTTAESFGNMVDGQAHFIRSLEGQDDVCGQDGETWPCSAWRKLSQPEPDPTGTVSIEQAARAAGMTPEELQRRLAEQP